MKNRYNYSDYLAEVHSLSAREHAEYIRCIDVIKSHVQKQLDTHQTEIKVALGRLNKLNTMIGIHKMMIKRSETSVDTLELVRLN